MSRSYKGEKPSGYEYGNGRGTKRGFSVTKKKVSKSDYKQSKKDSEKSYEDILREEYGDF